MKRNYLTLVVLVAFFSCTKSNENSSAINLDLIKEVENLPKSTVILGYQNLNNNEKVEFWNRHIDSYLNTHIISTEFKDHILKLKNFVRVDLYNTLGTANTDADVEKFTKEWYTDVVKKNVFPHDQLLEVGTIYGVGKNETTLRTMKTTAYSESSENSACNCYYEVSCWLWKNCISENICKSPNANPYNCGLVGTSRCTGVCQ